jgi:phosphodiesterase/alkaline phosphatase D-like protein
MNTRKCSLVAVLAAVACAVLALNAVPALALEEHPFLGEITGGGTPTGSFGGPSGVAVDEATGTLYVADIPHHSVDKLTLTGEPVNFEALGASALSGAATPAGSFAFPSESLLLTPAGVAVDNAPLSPSFNDIYVVDAGHAVIDKFAPSGAYLGQLTGTTGGPFDHEGTFGGPYGVGVDGSGNAWVYEPNGVVDKFNASGVFQSKFSTGCELAEPGFAVNSVGDVYLSCNFGIEEFSPTGTPLGALPRGGSLSGVAVDQSDDHVSVAQEATHVFEFDSSGVELVPAFPPSNLEGFADGLAVDGATGDLFLANTTSKTIQHWGGAITVPDVETGAATNVQKTTATLNGTVNPDGIEVTACEFEYGPTLSYGKTAPCTSEPGSGSSPAAVTAELSELEADETYHYRLIAKNAEGADAGGDQKLVTSGVPMVDEESMSGITQTSAMLEAELNPHGFDTTYRFEYGETTAYGISIPIPDQDIGAGSVDVPVDIGLSGLHAGTTYHYRVVATSSQGVTHGFDKSLTTVPSAQIADVSAGGISSTGATLSATIDPLENDTSYRFEYGTSIAYGASVPVAPVDIGAGDSAVAVTQTISGLQPNTTYHFRVVASNTVGTTTSPDHTFVYETTAVGLPDGRAYEMVTPVQKNGSTIGQAFLTFAPAIARNSSRAILPSIQCFGESQSCAGARGDRPGEPYSFTRTPQGWDAANLGPSAAQFGEISAGEYKANADLGTVLFSLPAAPGQGDSWFRTGNGSTKDIGPIYPPALGAKGTTEREAFGLAATADLERVVFQLGSEEKWPFDATVPQSHSLYEYRGVDQTEPELVAVSGGPGSTALVSTCGSTLGSQEEGGFNRISRSGEVVFFTGLAVPAQGSASCAGPPANELYARVDSSETREISARSAADCTLPACTMSPAANASFQGASEDGTRAYFLSTQQLTNEASEDDTPDDSATFAAGGGNCHATTGRFGCNLYLYDFNLPEGENPIDVSRGETSGSGPKVRGVLAVSSDGTHVYFVAQGVLPSEPNGQGQLPVPGGDNLYGYDRDAAHPAGRLVYIATLSEADAQEWAETSPGEPANVTPNGRFLVFLSHAALTPDDTRGEGPSQVYRFDDESGELLRLTKGQHGFNDDGNAGEGDANIVVPHEAGYSGAGPALPDPTMSDDGAYVFFESPIGLTRGALNDVVIGTDGLGEPGLAMNIYEYHDGEVSLISDGRDTSKNEAASGYVSGVRLLGSDASGANMFFTTADQLVSADTDTQFDVYDARIGGGFPAPVASPSCQGEACHGIPPATPSLLTPGTATFSGAGNTRPAPAAAVKPRPKVTPARCRKGSVRKHGRCVKVKKKKRKGKARKAASDRRARR